MKTFIALTILILGIASSGLSQTIPKENQVILSDTNDWPDIKWMPTEEQTSKALTEIERLLNDPEMLKKFGENQAKEVAEIREYFAGYRVQFYGILEGGRKYVYCNFFHNVTNFPDWKNTLVSVDDGGFWYWSILYDPETGELSCLGINGEA